MTRSEFWRLDGTQAKLSFGDLSAVVDVARPFDGLRNLLPYLKDDPKHRLFSIVLAGQEKKVEPVLDAYVRGSDLIASYDDTSDRPFQAQIYWRALNAGGESGDLAALEVSVAAHTELLDAHPDIVSNARLNSEHVLGLQDPNGDTFENIEVADRVQLDSGSGPGCFVFRRPGSHSYVQMVHPIDYRSTELGRDEQAVSVQHSLINRWMEKGVIVRSRMRGHFVERAGDLKTAAAAYRAFARSEVPLTT